VISFPAHEFCTYNAWRLRTSHAPVETVVIRVADRLVSDTDCTLRYYCFFAARATVNHRSSQLLSCVMRFLISKSFKSVDE